jgi:hypothetical protein
MRSIANWKVGDIIYPSASRNPVNMFLKLITNGEIRLVADLVPCNKITVENYEPIANQLLFLRTLERAKYRSTIDLAD